MKRTEIEKIIENFVGNNVICIDKSCVDTNILSNEVIVSPKWLAKRITRILRKSLSTSHNTDYDSELEKNSTPQGEICLVCGGSGQIDNLDLGGEGYRPCSNCDGQGKLSHNQ